MKTVTTPKGTELPLMNLKGKDYLMVAYRIQWFNEAADKFYIDTDFLSVTDEQTVARAKVTVFDKDGREIKHATATKRETKKDFPDHTEKAETGAVGRALALLGYGTQFAVSDLDEGDRLADSPLASPKKAEVKVENKVVTIPDESTNTGMSQASNISTVKVSTFRKPKTEATPAKADGWE